MMMRHENIGNTCKEEDFIQTIQPGQRGYGRYKYRVLGRHGSPTHHTNDLKDAQWWFEKCVKHWNTPLPKSSRKV